MYVPAGSAPTRHPEDAARSSEPSAGPLVTPGPTRDRSFANWNGFGCEYDDATFRGVADAIVSTGLAAAGYEYMLVQECIVPAGARNAVTHELQPDAAKFPFGLAALAAYFHSIGLKAGIYTDGAPLPGAAAAQVPRDRACAPVRHRPLTWDTLAATAPSVVSPTPRTPCHCRRRRVPPAPRRSRTPHVRRVRGLRPRP